MCIRDSNMCAGIFNAAGNSKRPLLYLGAASVVNIALDLILIQGFGMGVEGDVYKRQG